MINNKNKKVLLILVGMFLISSFFTILLLMNNNTTPKSSLELQDISNNLKNQISEGDCETYTNFYQEEFEKLEIETLRILLPVTNSKVNGTIILEGHTFLIAYDENGYCKLDQEEINCFKYN